MSCSINSLALAILSLSQTISPISNSLLQLSSLSSITSNIDILQQNSQSNALFSLSPDLLQFSNSCGGCLNSLASISSCSGNSLFGQLSLSNGCQVCAQELIVLEGLLGGESNSNSNSGSNSNSNSNSNSTASVDVSGGNSTAVASNSTVAVAEPAAKKGKGGKAGKRAVELRC